MLTPAFFYNYNYITTQWLSQVLYCPFVSRIAGVKIVYSLICFDQQSRLIINQETSSFKHLIEGDISFGDVIEVRCKVTISGDFRLGTKKNVCQASFDMAITKQLILMHGSGGQYFLSKANTVCRLSQRCVVSTSWDNQFPSHSGLSGLLAEPGLKEIVHL